MSAHGAFSFGVDRNSSQDDDSAQNLEPRGALPHGHTEWQMFLPQQEPIYEQITSQGLHDPLLSSGPPALVTGQLPYSDTAFGPSLTNEWPGPGPMYQWALPMDGLAAGSSEYIESPVLFDGSQSQFQPLYFPAEEFNQYQNQPVCPSNAATNFSTEQSSNVGYSNTPSTGFVFDMPQVPSHPQDVQHTKENVVIITKDLTSKSPAQKFARSNKTSKRARSSPSPGPSPSPEPYELAIRRANARASPSGGSVSQSQKRNNVRSKKAKTSEPQATKEIPGLGTTVSFTKAVARQTPTQARRGKEISAIRKDPSKRSVRSGPLSTELKEKIDEVRFHGACWRCKRYKKPCSVGALVCKNCSTSGLRLWPSSFGCRRGDWSEFAMIILPAQAEQVLTLLPQLEHTKPPSWRKAPKVYLRDVPNPELVKTGDKWERLCAKVLCMQVFGSEFIDLIKIIAHYQRHRQKEDHVLNLTANSISYSCDVYQAFVRTSTPVPPEDLLHTITEIRNASLKTFSALLACCLTGRMANWIVAFLSTAATVCGLVVFTDAIVAMPPTIRAQLWPNAQVLIKDLRDNLYNDAMELLIVLAKGMRPLKFQCWSMVEKEGADGLKKMVRSPEGMRLVGGDEGAFDGMMMLQAWVERYRELLDTDVWLANKPHVIDVHPISSLSALVMKVGGAFSDGN